MLIHRTSRHFKIGKSPRINEIFQVPIETLDKHGFGIVTIEWDTMQKQLAPTTLRVRGALPGETVRFRVASVYSTGSAVHTVRMSLFGRREHLIRPQRDGQIWRSSVEPSLLPADHEESKYLLESGSVCPHFDRRHDEQSCAGCTVPHMQYTRQMIEKTKSLRESLRGVVEDEFLNSLEIIPKSTLTRYSSSHELHAFSARPMEPPQWGQPSFKDPLPGERRKKYFVPTPQCKLIPKSAGAILNRFGDLVSAVHSGNAELFSVFDERLNRGFLRSVIIQQNQEKQHLVSIVTARPPSERFISQLRAHVTSRLINEFPDQIVGIQLVQASTDLSRDKQFFDDKQYVTPLEGVADHVGVYLKSANKTIPVSLGTSPLLDAELANSVAGDLVETLGCSEVLDEPDGILELYGGKGELTGILSDLTKRFETIRGNRIDRLFGGVNDSILEESGALPIQGGDNREENAVVVNASDNDIASTENNIPFTPDNLRKLPANFKGTAVLSFPDNHGKDEIKGTTSKQFRHWLTNTLRPKRVVYVTEKFAGLRKDIGHLKLLGYELKQIKAYDGQPGAMDKIVVFAVLERRPTYVPLAPEQLIE